MPTRTRSLKLFMASLAILVFSNGASADPPSRVARLGYASGAVSFSPAAEVDWVAASINRPLTNGDRLWADAGARAEIQLGGAILRMNAGTGISVLNLDDQIAQLELSQGTLSVRVRRFEPNQAIEIDTPNLALVLREPGEYRIEVDPESDTTTIIVRKGRGEVYGEGAAYVIDSGRPYRVTGTGLRDYQYLSASRLDEFDRWSGERDRRYDNSVSARYVSQDVVGYQDLDANGSWRVDANYGNVWIPARVAPGWAPYRDGHWAWVDPWGWTWVDDAPWGFAVSHYGRWANLGGTWAWVPGPVRSRAYYAPALVAFVGGSNFQVAISGGNVGGVAWFPLGPREVYRPSYAVSRGYFENVNRSNTVINTTVINNHYNNTNITNVVYANRTVPGAVVAVPTTTFVQSRPVRSSAVRVTRDLSSAPVAAIAPVAPTERSVRGAAGPGGKPPSRVFERPVVARSAPPASPIAFAAQQQQLASKPGAPLDDAARKPLTRAAGAPKREVKVVAESQTAAPALRSPPANSAATTGETRERSTTATPPNSAAPSQGPRPASPQRAPATPAASSGEQPGKAEQRDGEMRGKPAAAPQGAPSAQVATPPAPASAPVVQSPDQRGRAGGDKDGEPRERPAGPPPAAPQRGNAPPVQPPRDATPSASPQRAVPTPSQLPREAGASPARERSTAPSSQSQREGVPSPEPQRGNRPSTPAQVAPSVLSSPEAERRTNRDAGPTGREPQQRPPVAAPAPPSQPTTPAPRAEPAGKASKPAPNQPDERKRNGEEPKRDEDNRKPKG